MPTLEFERVAAGSFDKRYREILKLVPRSSGDIEKIVVTKIDPVDGKVLEYLFVYWTIDQWNSDF